MKYAPGPIGSLIGQADAASLQLTANQEDELEFRRIGRAPIPLTKWGKKAWSCEVKKHINDNLLRDLREAVRPAQDDNGQELPPRRKDTVGFPSEVDRQATTALLENLPNNFEAAPAAAVAAAAAAAATPKTIVF